MSVVENKENRARWYILQAHSGLENKVVKSIEEKKHQYNLDDYIEEVFVPMENAVEIVRGKKKIIQKKIFPGYILVKLVLSEKVWNIITNIPRVNGFLGSGGKPQPIPEGQVNTIYKRIDDSSDIESLSAKYEVADNIKVIDGPFESFVGVVEDVDNEKEKLKVSVSIFGRSTPVELNFDQVQRVES